MHVMDKNKRVNAPSNISDWGGDRLHYASAR